MPNVFRTLQYLGHRAPHVPELVEAIADAKDGRGDLFRLAKAGLNIAQPGSANHVDELARGIGRSLGVFAGRVTGGIPAGLTEEWADFALHHLPALKWGVIAFIGKKNSGKTTGAGKIGWLLAENHGYQMETVNWYEDDRRLWVPEAVPIPPERIPQRIRKLNRYRAQVQAVIDDGLTDEDLVRPGKKKRPDDKPVRLISEAEIDKMCERVTIVDEAGDLLGRLATIDQGEMRGAMQGLDNQIRHLRSLLILMVQDHRQLPGYLLKSAICFYKEPDPQAEELDEIDGRRAFAKERWAAVKASLGTKPWLNYDRPPFNDRRTWCHVIARNIGGHGYEGLCPIAPRLFGDEIEGE